MELQKGQKCKLADLTGSGQLRISVTVSLPGSEADVTCFGVDGAGKLSDDRYFIFYNQTSSPEGAVSMHQSGESAVFSVDLNRLPGFLQRLVVTVAAESGTMQALARGLLTLEGELDRAAYVFTGAGYQQEKALILCEVYRKDGIWRFSVVDSGFNGGLSALLAHFGGEEVKPDLPTPAPAQAGAEGESLQNQPEEERREPQDRPDEKPSAHPREPELGPAAGPVQPGHRPGSGLYVPAEGRAAGGHPGPGQLRCRRSAPLHQAGQGRPLRRQRQRRKHGLLPAGADRLRRGFRLHL